jgi:predicted PurR-regulated permease PerM
MIFDIEAMQDWLLKSILGVIVLGAIGSIIGAIIYRLIKTIVIRIGKIKDRVFMWIMQPIFKGAEKAEKFRELFGHKSTETKYIAYMIYEASIFIGNVIILFISLAITIIILLFFSLDKPIALSAFIAINIFMIIETLKQGLYLLNLLSNDTINTIIAFEKGKPKKSK